MVRRAERDVVHLAEAEVLNPVLVRYLNRLSDHLFVLARACNADASGNGGAGDVLWVPGG
jgi:cob(I)alamin adenosyltransferase